MQRSPAHILITGSAGLIGGALARSLRALGHPVVGLDLRGPEPGDVRNPNDVARALDGCRGVVHLAAVSRVIWGEADPAECWSTNVDGTRNVITAALGAATAPAAHRPWLLFASSREVYGQPAALPATEDTPLSPINVYGRSKVAGEQLASLSTLPAAIVRLSNVYGAPDDHPDRVVPAFARAALAGTPLRVDGAASTFDFTHLDDTVRGLIAAIAALDAHRTLPPLHLSTGTPTTLGELAHLAIELAGSRSPIVAAPPRVFDVPRFVGDPARAAALLGWTPTISLRAGLTRLIAALRA